MEQGLQNIPSVENFQTLSDIFKQLGDGSRLCIFWLLCHCEECVVNFSAMVGMSSPAVSHHLKLLRSAGLIINRREGKEIYYTTAGSAAPPYDWRLGGDFCRGTIHIGQLNKNG